MQQLSQPIVVSQATPDERAAFLRRTYMHLAGALFAFVFIEALLIESPLAPIMLQFAAGSRFGWLIVLGAFMFVGHIANKWALSGASLTKQYAGLGLYVVFEAVLFLPMLFMAVAYSSPDVLPNAAMTTVVLFGGLTGVVFVTGKDFSFMKGILGLMGLLAMAAIIGAVIFGFSLGFWFSLAMVGFAGGYVLYTTSNVMLHYRTDQHVAASLALFAAIALMFWYVLRIFMSKDR